MNERHLVLTPEKVVISYAHAGVGSRTVAAMMDLLVTIAIIFAVVQAAALAGLALGNGMSTFIISIGSAFASISYYTLMEGLGQGRTVGKMMTGLRVLMKDGTPVTFSAALYRNLLRPGDMLPGIPVVGLVTMFMNRDSQRLGDLAAGTIVAQQITRFKNFAPAPHRAGIHPFESSVGDLSRMTLEEYFAIKRLTDRFPELPPAVQAKSIQDIWQPFAAENGIKSIENVHPIYLMEAVVMKFGRMRKLI